MSFNFPYPGPIPPYTNVPIEPQYYQPRRYVISNITLGPTTIVTTTDNMDYVVGQQVRLIVPSSFGSRQLNESQAYVISIPQPNQVELTLNSSQGVDAYIASSATTTAQILAIGDINSGIINNTGIINFNTSIPGSFINISPK